MAVFAVFLFTKIMAFISVKTEEVIKEQKLQESSFTMTEEDQGVLSRVIRDYNHARNLKNKGLREFNDLSVDDRQSADQSTFNAYIPPKNQSEEESWKAQTKRPSTRNKVITIAAKITANILAPHVFAQNNDQEEDKDAAKVMETVMQWVNENSDYERSFLNAVIAMLVNPCAYVYVDYSKPEDDLDIGFRDYNVPLDEILLANNYISNIQDQPYIIRDRMIEFSTAEAKYEDKENFEFVKPGAKFVFSASNSQFYYEYDQELENRLVNEVIYWNKRENLQLVYLNGVPITSQDNKMDRKSKKYPFVKGGYEQIDEGLFAYFKSLVFKLDPEQSVLDEMYNMALDGTLLNTMPASALYGEESIDSAVIVPGGVTTFSDPNTKMEILNPRGDINGSWNAIQDIENQMSEASQGSTSASGLPQMTAFQTAVIEENNRVQLGLFGKMIGLFIKDWGELKLEDIVTHLPVADLAKIDSGNPLSYKTLLTTDMDSDKTTKVQFRSDLPEDNITPEEDLALQLDVLEEEKKTGQTIYRVNPKLFRELKYKVKVSVDSLFKPTAGILRAFNLEGYDRMVMNPLITGDPESFGNVTRDMLVAQYKPNSVEKYVPTKEAVESKLQEESAKQEQLAKNPQGMPADEESQETVEAQASVGTRTQNIKT